MENKITAGVTGTLNTGKTTWIAATISSDRLPTGHLEKTAYEIEIAVDPVKAAQGVFTRVNKSGTHHDLPIESLSTTLAEDIDEIKRLIQYVYESPFLERWKLSDSPGNHSVSKETHNLRAAEFVKSPIADVFIHVVVPEGLNKVFTGLPDDEHALPCPRILVVNKADQVIDWMDPTATPDAVIEGIVNRTKTELANLGPSDIVLGVFACSAIVALAGEFWSDEVLNAILMLAESGNLDLLSAHHFFNTPIDGLPSIDERTSISVAANRPLLGDWVSDTSYQPAFPAIRYAIGLTIREGIKTANRLRERLIKSSGVEDIRSALVSLAEDPVLADALTFRRQRLQEAEDFTTHAQSTKRDQMKTRKMRENVYRLESIIIDDEPLGHTESRQRCEALHTYLAEQDTQLALDFQNVFSQVSDLRQHYLHLIEPRRIAI